LSMVLQNQASGVAPHAGAWIETVAVMLPSIMETGRAPRGRVD